MIFLFYEDNIQNGLRFSEFYEIIKSQKNDKKRSWVLKKCRSMTLNKDRL